jgi:hypothetical protein
MYDVVERSIPVSPLTVTHPHESRSKRYSFISTGDIVDTFVDQGFQVRSITYPKARKAGKEGYGGHLVRLQPSSVSRFMTGVNLTEEMPEVILINSFDGSKSFRLGLGFIRFVCMNGLITGDMLADTNKVMHSGNATANVLEYIDGFSLNVQHKIESITNMKNLVLSSSELEEFQIKASEIVHPSIVNPHQLLHINRRDDMGSSLWKAFNVVQENAMKGSFQINGATTVRKARPIKDITRSVNLNTKLWSLAESFLPV